jgi:hypothetical protein
LRAATPAEAARQQSLATTAQYVGSTACERCHSSIYSRWKNTPMANVVRDPREHPDAIIPDLKTNTVSPFTLDQVAFVYGSKWKQRYFTRIGDDYYPLPVQWDIGNKTWRPYHVADTGADWWTAHYPSSNMERPTGPTCDGCHSVNYDAPQAGGNDLSRLPRTQRSEWSACRHTRRSHPSQNREPWQPMCGVSHAQDRDRWRSWLFRQRAHVQVCNAGDERTAQDSQRVHRLS